MVTRSGRRVRGAINRRHIASILVSARGRTLTTIPRPPNALNDSSYNYKLLLPTGQVLETDFTNDVEIIELYPPPAARFGGHVSTAFDIRSSIELGAAKLIVIANGIRPSPPRYRGR